MSILIFSAWSKCVNVGGKSDADKITCCVAVRGRRTLRDFKTNRRAIEEQLLELCQEREKSRNWSTVTNLRLEVGRGQEAD